MKKEDRLVYEMLAFVAEIFRYKERKNTARTPYIVHLVEVWNLVKMTTSDLATILAALLHDAKEDVEGAEKMLHERFADNTGQLPEVVATAWGYVLECSEDKDPADPGNKALTWKARKEEHLSRISTGSLQAFIIILADKISSVRSDIYELKQGKQMTGFNSSPEDGLWHYKKILAIGDKKFILMQDEKVKNLLAMLALLVGEFEVLIQV